jgi:hypothetical protein
MNKTAQFKVTLKRYLNTHSFYSVKEFLTFIKDSQYLQKLFFPYCFVVCTLHNVYPLCLFCVILCCIVTVLFLCYIVFYCDCVVFVLYCVLLCLCCFCVILCFIVSVLFLFCSFCIYLYVMYLYDLFHILLLPLQT